MTIRVGYIPYLNMVPFHQGFGPDPVQKEGISFEFRSMSPRALGLEAEKGAIDAGAMSLVDCLRLSKSFEPLGSFGIGLKRAAQSVLVFSKKPLAQLEGFCAVTDETSTSLRLFQVIMEARYGTTTMKYGRIASSMLFDGEADALLLIGDEAMEAKRKGIKGFPVVTDLGEEWYSWQGCPFVFARWVVRRDMDKRAKELLEETIETSLLSNIIGEQSLKDYWGGFAYKLTPEHEKSISLFSHLLEQACV